MKKILFLFLFSIISHVIFSQNNDLPAFMFEANTGYAVGVNLDSAMNIDAKLMYSFQKFGLILEGGSLLTPEKASLHLYIAPTIFLINNEKWRVPIALGFDLIDGKTQYYGIGGILSAHRSLAKNIYAGVNLGLTYAFDNRYDEYIGDETKTVRYNEGTLTQTVPVYQSKSHYGSYIYIKPSLSIGIQF
jgi:hypothetical protein